MKVNGKSKTPISTAQSKQKPEGGPKARTSQPATKKKNNGVKLAVLDRIRDGILAFDAGWNYTYLNERAGELLGRSADELIGKNLQEEHTGTGQPPFLKTCQRALATQSVVWLNEYFPATGLWLEGRVYPSEDGVSVLFNEGSSTPDGDRYQSLVASMQEAFLLAESIADENGEVQDYRFLDVNTAMEQLLGRPRGELVGRTARELFDFEGHDLEIVKRIARVGLGAEPFTIVDYSRAFQRWFRSHFFSPRPGQVAGMVADITESKRVEDQVREVSMFPEQNPAPVLRLSRDGKLLYANPVSRKLLSTSIDREKQAAWLHQVRALLPEVVSSNSNREVEIEHQGRVYSGLLVPIRDHGYVNLYFRDITERKRAEEAMRSLVNQAGAGIARTDMQGRFTFVNQVLCEMLGYSEAELHSLTIWDITDRMFLEKNRRLFEQMLAKGDGYQIEKQVTRRNGLRLWVSVAASPLRDIDGQIRGSTAVFVDIARRKRAEESLLDSARRSLFLSSLSDTISLYEDPAKIQMEAVCLLGAHLKTSRVAYCTVDPEDKALVRGSFVDKVPQMSGWLSLKDFLPRDQLSKFTAGRPALISDVQNDSRFSGPQRAAHEALQVRAHLLLPITRGGRVIAALLVQQSVPRNWRDEEISLLEESTERIQTAVERAQAEIRVRESEEKFRLLSNTVPSIAWMAAPDGSILYMNEHWYSYTGLPHDQDFSSGFKEVIHPEDYERYMHEGTQSLRTAADESVVEVRVRRHDGQYRWFQSRAVPARDAEGNITTWYGVTTDIHDRVEKEAELRQVFDITPFILMRCSRDLRYRFVSGAAARLLGGTPEQIEGRPLVDVLGESVLKEILPYIQQVLQGQPVQYEIKLDLPAKGLTDLQAFYEPDIDEQGKVIGWFASLIDVTSSKQAENAVRESQQRLSFALEKSSTGAWDLDLVDHTVFRSLEHDKIFGYQSLLPEWTYEMFLEHVLPEDREAVDRSFREATANLTDWSFECRIRRVDGEVRWIWAVGGHQQDRNGAARHMSGIVQDITRRKHLEERLRESERKFNLIYSKLPFTAALLRPDGSTFVDVNEEFEKVFGVSRQEAPGKTFADLGVSSRPEHGLALLAELQSNVPVRDFELELQTRPLGRRIMLINTDFVNIDGTQYILQTAQDITERKKVEGDLARERELLERIFASIPVMLTIYDPNVKIMRLNSQFEKLVGWSSQEATSISIMEACYPDPVYREQVRHFMDTCKPGEWMDIQMQTRDGRTLETSWSNIRLSNHVQVGIGIDITERVNTTQALSEFARQQEAFFHLADRLHNADMLEQVFAPALDAIQEALQCDRASILLFDEQGVMRFVAWRGLSDVYRQTTEGHSPWKADEKHARPVCVNEIESADLDDTLKAVIRAEGIGSLAFIPLVSGGRLLGKFMVYYNRPHVFDESDIELSQTIAHQLASSVERKRAGEELRQSRQRLELTYHHAPIGIAETSPQGRFLQVNDEFCRMLGYPYDELIHLGIQEVTHPDDLDQDLSLYKQLADGRFPSYRIEKRFVRKDGSVVWAELVRAMVLDEQGRALYGIAGVLDITARRQKEEELRARTEEIEALMEVSPIGIFFGHDPECTRITANPAGNQLVKMPEDSSTNLSKSAPAGERPFYRVLRDGVELKAEELPMQAAARLGMEIEEETLELQFENGQHKYIYAYAKPLFDVHGKARGAIAAMLDITQPRQREEELRARTEEIETLMNVSPIGILVAHDPECRQITGNPAAHTILGLPAEARENLSNPALKEKGQSHRVFRDGVELSVQDLPMQTSARLGIEVEDQTLELLFEDGSQKYIYIFARPLFDPKGRTRGAVAAVLDITDRRRNEDALRLARARAEQAAYRMAQLQKITAALSRMSSPEEIAKMVVAQGAPVIAASSSSVFILNEDQQTLSIMYSSAQEEVVRPFARIPMSARVPLTDAIRSGEPIWIASREEYLERYPSLAEPILQGDYQGAIAVPLVDKGHTLGALALSFKQSPSITPEDREYVLTLARQAAQALERARVENALRLDATMIENVSAGIYLVRASDGNLLHTNPRFDTLFGYAPGEVIGKPVSILNAPTHISPEQAANNIVESLRRDGAWQGEILSIRKDGTRFWTYSSVTTFEHPAYGTVWVAARQDISGQKQAEEGLRESEQRFRAIVSQATAGIVRKDATGQLLFVNQAFCDMVGMSETELKGRRIWEITHADDVGENKRLFDRLMAEGTPFRLEKRILRKDGTILWTSVSVSPVIDSHGKTSSAVSVYVDVTRRKQAENRLSLLAQVSELSREFDEPDELLFAVSRVVGEYFQAKRCLFNEIDLEHDREIVHSDYAHGVESVAGMHKISDYSSITYAEMLAGKTVVNRDSKLDPRTAPDYERTHEKNGERAYVAVPLLREDRWVASLWVSDNQPRAWDKEDISLLEAIAERTWTAAEKLRIDRALRASEERLRVTINTTVVGFAMLTPDTRFVDMNDAFCQLVGYSRQELLEITYEGLTHPHFGEETRKQVAQLLAGEAASFTIEKIFIRRDGGELWVQNSLSLVRDAYDDPLHLILICQDITERKRAEQELQQLNLELEERVRRRTLELQAANEFLRESEATNRLILESMPDAIVIIDHQGEIVHANRQVEMLFGYAPAEIMGKTVESLIPEGFHTKQAQLRFADARERNRHIMSIGQDLFGHRKDGSQFPVEMMLAPINNSTNWDILVAIRDNTRQRAAQEALRSNEEKLRTLFEIAPVGISFLNKEGKIAEPNNALAEMMSLTKSELLLGSYKSRKYIRADGTPMPTSEFASVRARAEQRTIHNVETGIVKENGEIVWTSVNAAPVNVADVDAVIVTVDITERKQAEEALHKHRERLKALSRRLVEVQEEERHAIARELHDSVGQNLAALTLNLNILRNQLSSETLEKVGTRLNDSVNLVKDILTITRSVMADLRPNVLDDYGLDAALSEYADRFMQRYGIRVLTHTPSKPTPRLDPGVEMTLLRIAQEALTNIARHSQATQAVMTLEQEKDAILMTIEDNGLGILSWQKVNQPGSHGLRIMRERAEAFGGYMRIQSTYKNGTKIEVRIPLTGSGGKEKKS